MANKNIYDIAKKVLSASNEIEARSFLFGQEGIIVNTREYYQKIITEFGRKKESIMPRDLNKTIHFDVEKNKEEIWNILYLGKIILEENKTQYNVIDDIDCVEINVPSSASQIDEKSLVELKKAIRVIQRVKDSTKHNKYKIKEDECKIIINNPEGFLEVDIPIRLLEQFNVGLITASKEEKHQNILRDTNNAAKNILGAINYDPKQLPGFFYNVSPNVLDILLSYVNNDVSKLYELPVQLFDYSPKLLRFFLDKFGKEDLSTFPSAFFDEPHVSDSLVSTFGIEEVKTFPETFFKYPKIVFNMLEKNSLYDIKRFPEIFFYNYSEFKKYLDDGYTIEDLKQFPDFLFRYYNLTKTTLNNYSLDEIKNATNKPLKDYNYEYAIKVLIGLGYSLHEIFDLPESIFRHVDEFNKIANDKYNPEYYEIIKKYIGESKEIPENFIKYSSQTRCLLEEYPINMVEKFPEEFFIHYKQVKAFLKKHPLEDIEKVPSYYFNNDNVTKFYLNKLGQELSAKLDENAYTVDINVAGRIVSMIKTYGLDVVNSILANGFFKSDDNKKLNGFVDEIYKKYIHRGKEFVAKLFDYKNLFTYFSLVKLDNLDILLNRIDFDVERLNEFPIEFLFFNKEMLYNLLEKYDHNICRSIFGFDDPKMIALVVYMDKVFTRFDKDANRSSDEAYLCVKHFSKDIDLQNEIDSTLEKSIESLKSNIAQFRHAIYNDNTHISVTETKVNNCHAKIIADLNRKLTIYTNDIMHRIRNAMSHYYYKPIGNNRILLWDDDINGNRIFEREFEMDELLEFTHSVEEYLDGKVKNENILELCDEFGLKNQYIEDLKILQLEIVKLLNEKDKILAVDNEEKKL